MMTPCPTVVVGMHRSGTSVLTACLEALGLSAPHVDEQIHAPDNPAHLEPRRIVLHNDALLAARGGSWKYPGELTTTPDPVWVDSAQRLLGEIFPDEDWVLKDPRMCVLLDAWSFLPRKTRYVLVGRDPVNVAASLSKRDSLSTTHGLALWDHYNAAAEFALQNKPVYVVTFEQLRSEPIRHLVALSEFLGLTGESDRDGRLSAAAEVIDPGLGRDQAISEGSEMMKPRWDHLRELTGAHETLDTDPFPPSVWSTDMLRVIRERDDVWRRRRRFSRRSVRAAAGRFAHRLARSGAATD